MRVQAERLRRRLRAADAQSRFADGHFACLIGPVQQATSLDALAHRLQSAVSTPVMLDGTLWTMRAQVGMATQSSFGPLAAEPVGGQVRDLAGGLIETARIALEGEREPAEPPWDRADSGERH